MKIDFPPSTGKLFGAYLFLGCCICLISFSNLKDLDLLKPNELMFFLISIGSLIGSLISTTQLHKIFAYLYGIYGANADLRKAMENDYQKFVDLRNTFYFRSIFLCGLTILLIFWIIFPWGRDSIAIIITRIFVEEANTNFLFFIYYGLLITSAVLWISSYYSNRDNLLLIRYLTHASRRSRGIPKLYEKVQEVHKEINNGHWEEAKSQFTEIIHLSNALIDKPEPNYHYSLYTLGFKFLNFKNQKNCENLEEITRKISKESSQRRTTTVKRYYKELETEQKKWKIVDWESFARENLPFRLKLDYFLSDLIKK